MKRLLLIGLASLTLPTDLYAKPADDWEVTSFEQQFDNNSELVYKTTSVTPQEPLETSKNAVPVTSQARQIAEARTLDIRPEAKNASSDFWIYDAWVEFYGDEDGDGFYSHFAVSLDADTYFSEAQVYARLYLGKNELFKEYHTTSTFTIYGDSSADNLVVESELLTGFTPGDYEVLIELYDEYSNELVAVIDGYNDGDLYLLPLESNNYEEVYEEPSVIIVTEHGGSMGWGILCLLPLLFRKKWISQR
ncbi:choice-of-anchor H family protein [Paraglaciecola marina]|uniref:choice-of-anchor H family protein n=1 Tax=Paraglaciecola marina TaxID=2500157 RepID=UPI0010606314|nr:choice-of-anchor H family protein [Paraglaciecola marina]